MSYGGRAVLAWSAALACAAAVSGCGGGQKSVRAVPPPPRGEVRNATATEAAAEPSEAVWHLRAGLNVAALSCRGKGRASVAPGYARLLSRHKALLASAYAAEQQRYGGALDRHQTKLYNRFAFQRSPETFCRTAAQVAGQANGLDSPGLSRAAPGLLSQLSR